MLAIRTEDNKVFKQISTPAFEDRVIADGGTVSSVDNTDKILDAVAAIGVQPSVVMVPSGIKASKLYSQIPYGGGADFTVTRSGTTGMRLNNGYWQPVAADTPRVDLTWDEATQMFIEYLNIEEARTNLISRYKSFAHSDWTKSGASIQGDPNTKSANKISGGDFESGLIGSISLGTGQSATWTINTDSPISGTKDGRLVVSVAGSESLRPTLNLGSGRVTGELRRFTFKYKLNSGTCTFDRFHSGANTIAANKVLSGSGTYTSPYFYVDGTTTLILYFSNTLFDLQIDDIDESVYTGYASPFVDSSGVNLMSGYKLVEGTNNGLHYMRPASHIGIATGVKSITIFAKYDGTRSWLLLTDDNVGFASRGWFNIQNGTVGGGAATKKITAYANGWYRCEVAYTSSVDALPAYLPTNADNVTSYLGDGTSGILISHAQLEAGATASSPIGGAEGSTQTRNADAIVKTGASALIGQTEGYMVIEFYNTLRTYDSAYLFRLYSDANNEIFIRKEAASTSYTARWRGSAINIYTKTSIPVLNGYNKIAIAWKSGDSAVALNGTVFTDTNIGSFNAIVDQIYVGNANGASFFNDRFKLVYMGKTRISNAQLQALTTL